MIMKTNGSLHEAKAPCPLNSWSRLTRRHIVVWGLLLLCVVVVSQAASNGENPGESSQNLNTQLRGLQTAAEAALTSRTKDAAKFEELRDQLSELYAQNKELEQLENELVRRTFELDGLVRQANAVQLQYLAWQLNQTLQEELKQRSIPTIQVEEYSNAVTREQLDQETELTHILEESEIQLEEWIKSVIRNEVALEMSATEGKCVTPIEAAQLVQASLISHSHDGSMVDHAKGAQIVYELTSETYIPPPEPNELLGNVWWRKFIPEDWERILPSGWENWRATIPSSMMHSMGLSADTLPPQAILTSATFPGTCWPMQGHTGQVTIRLPHPVKLKALTIDHASSLLVDVSSAPKTVRVIAYPPCMESDGMGFDVHAAWQVMKFEYNADGKSSQTFEVPTTSRDDESCSEEAMSCTAEAEPLGKLHVASQQRDSAAAAAAITIDVLDNWGWDDYTCLYRIRVHGDIVET